MTYNKAYFESLNYSDYMERAPKYKQLAREISSCLYSFNLINENSSILDYGCAVGFLIEGLHEAGFKNTVGYDISKWAIEQCVSKKLTLLNSVQKNNFDCIICLDVLEHMTDSDIQNTFSVFTSNMMIVRIPCSTDGNDFHLDVSRKDPTHCNCKTKNQWIEQFKELGYTFFFSIRLPSIYDSDGVLCCMCFKQSPV